MKNRNSIPNNNYGVLIQERTSSDIDEIVEQVRLLGYAVMNAGFTRLELTQISEKFNNTRLEYVDNFGEDLLIKADEYNTIRAPLSFGDPIFLRLATNKKLISVLNKLIVGKFILNQQNGIINPPCEKYNQGSWHRDLPYQHYVSSSPLAINALFCVDDFTLENGSTFLLPASHKNVNFPSDSYIQRNALQIQAKAGEFILLDCMLFHSGGFNRTDKERRAVNHVYTIPYFKQQIVIPKLLREFELTKEQKELLGFNFQEPTSISQYLKNKKR